MLSAGLFSCLALLLKLSVDPCVKIILSEVKEDRKEEAEDAGDVVCLVAKICPFEVQNKSFRPKA